MILSVRDAERWFESTQATIFAAKRERLQFPEFREFFDKNVYADFGERIHDRDYMIAAFERHNDEVRRAVSPQRLLVFDVKQGWKPLCELLGVPEPAIRSRARIRAKKWLR